jgi:hypothetical protein
MKMRRQRDSPKSVLDLRGPERMSVLILKRVDGKLTRKVICPATPSSNPYFPNMRKAAASRPLRYARSLYGSSNFGGLGKLSVSILPRFSSRPGSSGAVVFGLLSSPFWGSIADGGDMFACRVQKSEPAINSGRLREVKEMKSSTRAGLVCKEPLSLVKLVIATQRKRQVLQ